MLNRLTNVMIIVTCLATLSEIAYKNIARTSGASLVPARTPIYKAGEQFLRIPGVPQATGKGSLILVVRSTCKFCNESLPFYQTLATKVREQNRQVQLVGLCLEPSEVCDEYFKKANVPVDVSVGLSTGVPRISGTPTLLLLNDRWIVERVWIGALQPAAQRAVFAALHVSD